MYSSLKYFRIQAKYWRLLIEALHYLFRLAQKEDQLAALRTALSQKEKDLDQLGTQVESLRSEVNNQRSVTSRLQDDLEQQRSKNNVGLIYNIKVFIIFQNASITLLNFFI